mgnify:CR=1 FL=1
MSKMIKEIEQNETKKKYYILSKIQNYQDAKIRIQQDLITNLPTWQNELQYNPTHQHPI